MLLSLPTQRYDALRSAFAVRDRIVAQTFDRSNAVANVASPSSGVLYLSALALFAGQVCTSLSFATGAVGATTPSNWWLALYDRSLNLLAQSADQLTTAIASATAYTIALTSPYTVPITDSYYLGVMFAAATPPRLLNSVVQSQLSGFNHTLVGSSTSGLTTTPPNPAAALTPGTNSWWGAVT